MQIQFIDSGPASALDNMSLDATFLQELENSCIVHHYSWEKKAATYGYFVRPHDFFNEAAVLQYDLDLARRPTGGGIVFHVSDLAFSVLVPASHPKFSKNTLQNYIFINEIVKQAIESLAIVENADLNLLPNQASTEFTRFCMAHPTKYDVMWRGLKIGGAAQRVTKRGFLHQGTISIAPPSIELLTAVLKPQSGLLEAMQACSGFVNPDLKNLEKTRKDLKSALNEFFDKQLSLKL